MRYSFFRSSFMAVSFNYAPGQGANALNILLSSDISRPGSSGSLSPGGILAQAPGSWQADLHELQRQFEQLINVFSTFGRDSDDAGRANPRNPSMLEHPLKQRRAQRPGQVGPSLAPIVALTRE